MMKTTLPVRSALALFALMTSVACVEDPTDSGSAAAAGEAGAKSGGDAGAPNGAGGSNQAGSAAVSHAGNTDTMAGGESGGGKASSGGSGGSASTDDAGAPPIGGEGTSMSGAGNGGAEAGDGGTSAGNGDGGTSAGTSGGGTSAGTSGGGTSAGTGGGATDPVLGDEPGDMVQVASGTFHSCGLKKTGEVLCWGNNAAGQLGDDSLAPHSGPVLVPGVSNAVAISAGGFHSCALLESEQVACWGASMYGELGTGQNNGKSPDDSFAAHAPMVLANITDAVQVSAGYYFTCVLHATGTVTCFGSNGIGQLGGGKADNSTGPVDVVGISDAINVSAGLSHACAVRESGSVSCWGANDFGEVGDGTWSSLRVKPTPVLGIDDAVQVSAGEGHTCALLATGRARCWGNNGSFQLGNGEVSGALSPVDVAELEDATEIDAGAETTCARKQDGTALCWGDNSQGQLGDGTTDNHAMPFPVPGLKDVENIDTGNGTYMDSHTCAARSTGTIACWGRNKSGEVGDGTSPLRTTPVQVLSLTDAVELSAGGAHTCARRAAGALGSGRVVCWGDNSQWQIAHIQAIPAPPDATTPILSGGPTDAVEIAAGALHTCARTPTGPVQCWGYYNGNESKSGPSGATHLTAGSGFNCAVTSGVVYCWGSNYSGALGDGTGGEQSSYVMVKGLYDAIDVVAGAQHACALREDGSVACWGANFYGQLGNGSSSSREIAPVAVAAVSNPKQLAAGFGHTCALQQSGKVVCWGGNYYGTLGNGSNTDSLTPVTVSGLTDAVEIAAGGLHNCARRAGGSVVCWGRGRYGSLGRGSTSDSNVPVAVVGLSDAVELAASNTSTGGDFGQLMGPSGVHTCARRAGGTVVCWGADHDGELGDGIVMLRARPLKVVGL